jgi:hypothetical protein
MDKFYKIIHNLEAGAFRIVLLISFLAALAAFVRHIIQF